MKRHSLAQPLAWLFAALVVYASLYPFAGWRGEGINPLGFVTAPLPRYWSAFDVFSNLVGYMPLGFLLALSAQRREAHWWAWLVVWLSPSLLSFTLELLQVYLPGRVPSNVDWALNTAGAWLGVMMVLALRRTGLLPVWERVRTHWFVPGSDGALVLLCVWPVALLYPTSVPFALGQVWHTVGQWAAGVLAGTPWASVWPSAGGTAEPLTPAEQSVLVALALLVPGLLAHSVLRPQGWFRVWGVAVVCLGGMAWMGLSSALTHGPVHAWAWLTAPVGWGWGSAGLLLLLMLRAPRAVCWVLLLLALLTSLVWLNLLPRSPYLAESLDIWAQGRFIRFHGLTQWLGNLWPFVVLGLLLTRGLKRSGF